MTTLSRRLTYGVAILIAGGFAFAHLRGPNGLTALLEKRREIRLLEQENAQLKADNERRRQRNTDLQKDPNTWELEIRKRTEKIKKGETDFKLPAEQPVKPADSIAAKPAVQP